LPAAVLEAALIQTFSHVFNHLGIPSGHDSCAVDIQSPSLQWIISATCSALCEIATKSRIKNFSFKKQIKILSLLDQFLRISFVA
jgi:hypothetical protein